MSLRTNRRAFWSFIGVACCGWVIFVSFVRIAWTVYRSFQS